MLVLVALAGSGGTARPAAALGDASALAGLCLVGTDAIAAREPGQGISKEALFGDTGVFARDIRTAGLRTIARAPDGRMSVRFDIPPGRVPATSDLSRHFRPGTRHAAVAADLWLPADFAFPTDCRYPGQGRWPIGLWAGLPGQSGQPSGGGEPVAGQDSVSIRLNRSGRGGARVGQAARVCPYVYNLNRAPGACEAGKVCSVGCSDPGRACYGSAMGCSAPLPRGRWVTVELEATMNDPGSANGCVAYAVDGTAVGTRCGYDFGADRGWLLQGFYGYSMWHCNGSPKAQSFWLSNFRFYGSCHD